MRGLSSATTERTTVIHTYKGQYMQDKKKHWDDISEVFVNF